MPVKLYVSANGVPGLQTFIDKQTKQNLSAKGLSTWAGKLLDKSAEVAKNADQEKEYIFGTAYIDAVLQLRRTKEFKTDPKYYNPLPIMKKLTLTLDRMEELKNTLTERYDEFNHAQKAAEKMAKEHEAAEKVKAAETASNLTKRLEDELGKLKNCIDPEKLVLILRNYGDDLKAAGGMLLLDIRRREEFNRNRIQFLSKWHVPSVVHVPIENAIPGVIGTKLVNNSLLKTDYSHRHRFKIGKYHRSPYRI